VRRPRGLPVTVGGAWRNQRCSDGPSAESVAVEGRCTPRLGAARTRKAQCSDRRRTASQLIAQQDLREQTAFRQKPEKFHDRRSQTYSAQTPLSGNVPQPVEHRWPV
jgi:hypothetical protein